MENVDKGTHRTKMGADSLGKKYPKLFENFQPKISAQAQKFGI